MVIRESIRFFNFWDDIMDVFRACKTLGILLIIVFVNLQLTACATKMGKGFQHLEDHEYPEALVLFKEVANDGIRVAAIMAADLYISDYQIPRNLEKSEHYLQVALDSEYQCYDQAYDYYIPLIKAYQLLANNDQQDKSFAFEILNYEKYQEYTWPLNTLALCHLVGYGTEKDIPLAQEYFEKAVKNQIYEGSNVFYAWWLSVYPDESFRDPQRALEFALEVVGNEDFMDKPLYLDTLAATYAINSQFEKAVETQQKALQILGEYTKKYAYMAEYQTPFEARLSSYREQKSWVLSSADIDRCGYDSKVCLKK